MGKSAKKGAEIKSKGTSDGVPGKKRKRSELEPKTNGSSTRHVKSRLSKSGRTQQMDAMREVARQLKKSSSLGASLAKEISEENKEADGALSDPVYGVLIRRGARARQETLEEQYSKVQKETRALLAECQSLLQQVKR